MQEHLAIMTVPFSEMLPLAIKLSPLSKHFLESWLFYRWIESCPGFPGGSDGKEFACSAGDPGLIPGSRRSPGEGHDNPLQYSCLENPMDREEPGRLQSMRSQTAGQDWMTHMPLGSQREQYKPCTIPIWSCCSLKAQVHKFFHH